MEHKSFHRKLTAILSADVAGYSRLMQNDESATVKTLETYKQIISDLVKQHRGRVVDSPGDNLLAEFASVVDAVQCAVATQKELQARNSELPENCRMQFRIGVNLGDVIEEESRIYGDGVNIAAGLVSLAEPGGICVSKTTFEHIESKLPFDYTYLGERTVKNIAKPIGAYKVLMGPQVVTATLSEKRLLMARGRTWVIVGAAAILVTIGAAVWALYWRAGSSVEAASKEKMAFPLPPMPSIAVLPFANKSEDTKMELFCDGVTANIITALSRVSGIMVIARGSTLAYKGSQATIKQVSEGLGVQYVLEGSVQKSGDRIRLTAQLFDALKGTPEWAETYDRDLKDIFALQDEIAMKVLTALRVELAMGEHPSVLQKHYKGKQGLDCYTKQVQAGGHISRWNLEDINLGRRLAEELITMCPDTPIGYSVLGWYYHHAYTLDPAMPREQALEKSMELAQKAISIDDSISDAYSLLCSCYFLKGELEKAIDECERALSLNPGSLDSLSEYGWSLTFAGRYQEAIHIFQKIIRRNPYAKSGVFRGIGLALLFTGQLEEAVAAFKTGVQRSPNDVMSHMFLAGAYSMQGREKEAAFEVAETFRINPKFSVENFVMRWSGIKDEARRDALMNAVAKAALLEKAPVFSTGKPE
jgi:adenylate cyclase